MGSRIRSSLRHSWSQRSPDSGPGLTCLQLVRAELRPPWTCQALNKPLLLGSGLQCSPSLSPCRSPLSYPSLSVGLDFITHPFDTPASAQPSPFVCTCVCSEGLSHSLCIYCSFLSCLTPLILLVSAPKCPPPGTPQPRPDAPSGFFQFLGSLLPALPTVGHYCLGTDLSPPLDCEPHGHKAGLSWSLLCPHHHPAQGWAHSCSGNVYGMNEWMPNQGVWTSSNGH